MKHIKKLGLILSLFFLSAIVLGAIFLSLKTYEAMPEALGAIQKANVTLQRGLYRFEPEGPAVANVILYQGGLVKTEAYAVLSQMLSEEGFRVFLPKMPLNLAILNADAHEAIMAHFSSDLPWYIGGHSLGAATAVIAISDLEEEVFDGLFLLGGYGTEQADLSAKALKVISISASEDGVMNQERYALGKRKLPIDTWYETIQGGNHSGFGFYGPQKGDGIAALSKHAQHEVVVNLISAWIKGESR